MARGKNPSQSLEDQWDRLVEAVTYAQDEYEHGKETLPVGIAGEGRRLAILWADKMVRTAKANEAMGRVARSA